MLAVTLAAPGEPPRPRVRGSLEDGFGIDSADGQHGVSVNALATLAYELGRLDDHVEHGFRLVYMRPTLKAHLRGKMFRFAFQPAFDGPSPRLILAFGHIELHEAFAIRAGVYRPYYARGFIVGLEPQLLPDRGPIISEFASGNDLGVTVMGKPFGGKLEYYASAINGEGVTPRNVNPQMLLIGRLVYNPLGPITYAQTPQLGEKPLPFRIGVGVNGYTNEVRESRTMTDPITTDERTSIVDRRDVGGGGEVALHWRRLSGQAEAFYRWRHRPYERTQNAWGTYAQVGIFALPDRLEPALRVSVMDLDDTEGVRVPIEAGLNLYLIGNNATLQAAYTCDLRPATDACNSHLGILQAQFTL